jgi:SAM-dependent methyltransferase
MSIVTLLFGQEDFIAFGLPPESVLDVACCTGDQLSLLTENSIDAVGVDMSEAMLRICRKANPVSDCLLQDATDMAFHKGKSGVMNRTIIFERLNGANGLAGVDRQQNTCQRLSACSVNLSCLFFITLINERRASFTIS